MPNYCWSMTKRMHVNEELIMGCMMYIGVD